MDSIPGTSNICERFFSKAKFIFGLLRQNLTPMDLEAALVLRVNKDFWDAERISSTV